MVKVLILREIFRTGKTAPWNSPKSWVNILRTTVAALGGRRRHGNGGFGTDFFCRYLFRVICSARKLPRSGKLQKFKNPRKRKKKKQYCGARKVKVGNCPKSWVKILRTLVGRRAWKRVEEAPPKRGVGYSNFL